MADTRSVTVRIPTLIDERMMASVERAGCTTTEWIVTAIRLALEQDERPHVPAVVKAAMPKRVGNLMSMPDNVVHYRNI
jgi:hypothetical protein